MKDLLTDLLEYMESRADADIEGPNKEMGFQIRIEEALAKMEKPRFPHMETHEIFDLPAPNTVMWWLCRIADPEIRRKAVENQEISEASGNRSYGDILDISEAVWCGFVWKDTMEGNDYWEAIYDSEIPLLPEPDFTEYLELRK